MRRLLPRARPLSLTALLHLMFSPYNRSCCGDLLLPCTQTLSQDELGREVLEELPGQVRQALANVPALPVQALCQFYLRWQSAWLSATGSLPVLPALAAWLPALAAWLPALAVSQCWLPALAACQCCLH